MAPLFTANWFNFGRNPGGTVTVPFTASGGNVDGATPGNGYKDHVFTSPGNFVVSEGTTTANYCIVGGGGAGGAENQ